MGRGLPLLLLLLSCADAAPTRDLEVAGFVLEIDTREPIEGARVTFRSDTLYEVTTTSDEEGRYELFVVSDSKFGQVIAEKEGFSTAEQSVFFDQPQRRIDLEMRAQ